MKCFGEYHRSAAACRSCEYCTSCQLFTETEDRMTSPLGGQDYDSVGAWAPDLAAPEPPDDETEPEPRFRDGDFTEFLAFIFRLDDYTLGILAEILAPSKLSAKPLNVAELSRRHGVSRQAMHRKLLALAAKRPELAALLRIVLLKIRKARREFHPETVPPSRGFEQPELELR